MAHILNRLVNGSASTFNKQTNVRLDNKYTVLDISSLTGDLLTVGMFVALDFVWDRAKADRTEEKAIFIDECWQLLSGAGAAGVRLAGSMKPGRKTEKTTPAILSTRKATRWIQRNLLILWTAQSKKPRNWASRRIPRNSWLVTKKNGRNDRKDNHNGNGFYPAGAV